MQASENLGLHDAEVIAITVDRLIGVARLTFRQESGALRLVEMHGLEAFRSEDMTLQNVVSRVLCSSRGHFSKESLKYWIRWITSLSDADSWLSDKGQEAWLVACEAGSLELVVVEPSAGAQIAGLCERLVLKPGRLDEAR